MDRKRTGPGGGGPFGRGPREDHPAEAPFGTPPAGSASGRGPREDHPAEAPFGVPPVGSSAIDPELETDLGAEFEFRGDVLESELEGAKAEAATHLEAAQRLQAEFDNYRKRMAREQEDAARRAGQRIIDELLPALDNLERALAHVEAGGEGAQLVDGVRMVLQQVLDVFGKEGVERIDPLGQPFDPSEHQAVGQAQRDEVDAGTVIEVYQRGYRMHGRVLRPATVVVSTGAPDA